jgi:predicted nucleotidyltransferase
MDVFEKDILDFFHLLNTHSVRYILVGGLAVNYHGFSRSTGDVDLWLDDSKENRIQFVEALREKKIEGCEAFLTYPFLAGFAEILLENGIYIDLMSDLQFFKQDQFDECYQLSNIFKINDIVQFKVLHINKLIEEKGRSARTKDKEDAEQLKKLYEK